MITHPIVLGSFEAAASTGEDARFLVQERKDHEYIQGDACLWDVLWLLGYGLADKQ